jgi:hypothetical protein
VNFSCQLKLSLKSPLRGVPHDFLAPSGTRPFPLFSTAGKHLAHFCHLTPPATPIPSIASAHFPSPRHRGMLVVLSPASDRGDSKLEACLAPPLPHFSEEYDSKALTRWGSAKNIIPKELFRTNRPSLVMSQFGSAADHRLACAPYYSLLTAHSLHEEALGAAEVHDAEAVAGSDFVLHAVEVVLDGLLGKAKLVGDFFVGQTLSDERNDLLFAAS